MNTNELNRGDRVSIDAPADANLWQTNWWPATVEHTGTVERTFKNGDVAVAIDQLRNRSNDGRKTIHLPAAWITVLS